MASPEMHKPARVGVKSGTLCPRSSNGAPNGRLSRGTHHCRRHTPVESATNSRFQCEELMHDHPHSPPTATSRSRYPQCVRCGRHVDGRGGVLTRRTESWGRAFSRGLKMAIWSGQAAGARPAADRCKPCKCERGRRLCETPSPHPFRTGTAFRRVCHAVRQWLWRVKWHGWSFCVSRVSQNDSRDCTWGVTEVQTTQLIEKYASGGSVATVLSNHISFMRISICSNLLPFLSNNGNVNTSTLCNP